MKLMTFKNPTIPIHFFLNVFIFDMSLDINFEIVPSAAKPILTVFNDRMFSLLSKSMSQIFLLFSMTSPFTINESN